MPIRGEGKKKKGGKVSQVLVGSRGDVIRTVDVFLDRAERWAAATTIRPGASGGSGRMWGRITKMVLLGGEVGGRGGEPRKGGFLGGRH